MSTEDPLYGLLDLYPAYKVSDTMSVVVSVWRRDGESWVDIRRWYRKSLDGGRERLTPSSGGLKVRPADLDNFLSALDSLRTKWGKRLTKPVNVE